MKTSTTPLINNLIERPLTSPTPMTSVPNQNFITAPVKKKFSFLNIYNVLK